MLFSEPKIPQYFQSGKSRVRSVSVSVLFSEPKIPQSKSEPRWKRKERGFSALQRAENSSMLTTIINSARNTGFSALQRAENSSMRRALVAFWKRNGFQCSSASRKFLNRPARSAPQAPRRDVSVLFSEPKIPQSVLDDWGADRGIARFSALQRAENSSILRLRWWCASGTRSFSALQRAENSSIHSTRLTVGSQFGFSALQRAENSSIVVLVPAQRPRIVFQCSSASRKFLNLGDPVRASRERRFQCSSASRKFLNFLIIKKKKMQGKWFQCSSASRKFLNSPSLAATLRALQFQCSSASRKFLNCATTNTTPTAKTSFQCSSASRKFLNRTHPQMPASPWHSFQCSSASRKFLNPDPRTCVHPYFRPRRSRFVISEPSWCVAMTPVY